MTALADARLQDWTRCVFDALERQFAEHDGPLSFAAAFVIGLQYHRGNPALWDELLELRHASNPDASTMTRHHAEQASQAVREGLNLAKREAQRLRGQA